MSTVPRVTLRSTRLVEMVFQNDPTVRAMRVGAANTLDQAYTGTTAMFDVLNPGTYRSRGIRRRRLGMTQYNNRNLSRAIYDPEDFWAPAGTLPHDGDQAYVRVREIAPGGGARPEGPILVVPHPGFFTTPRPMLTIRGTAPNIAASATGLPPEGVMDVYMPRFFDYCSITNLEAVGGDSMWISFDRGMPELEVPAATSRDIFDAADNELLIRSAVLGGVSFQAVFAIVNGEMA